MKDHPDPNESRAGVSRLVTVFTAGCFNRIHKAHYELLLRAKALGNRLVVGLSHDANNRKPYAVPAVIRRARLESLGIADEVVVGEPDRFCGTLQRIDPQIIVLGYDQRLPDEETQRIVTERGIELVRFPWFQGKEKDWIPPVRWEPAAFSNRLGRGAVAPG